MYFGKRRILIVDGDQGWRSAVFRALAPHGYDLEQAEPEEDRLRQEPVRRSDLVVVRLSYPDLEGWRVCRLLRSIRDPNHAPAPVLLLSDSIAGDEARLLTAAFGGQLVVVPAPGSAAWADAVAEAASRHLNRTGAESLGGADFPSTPTGTAIRRYHLIAEQSRTVYWEVDAEGLYTYVSHLASAIWGYSPAELIGKLHFYDLHPARDRERLRRAEMEMLASGKSFRNFENPIERKDGSVIWVLTSGVPITGAGGELAGYHGCDTEVTDLHRAEVELERQRRRLVSVIEGTNAGTWEWDIRTGAAVFNERWAAIVGYELRELEPVSIRTWARLAHPDDLAASNEALLRHFMGETEHYDVECRMRRRDGSWVWVHDRGKVVEWDAAGLPLRMAGTHTDISARKQAELELAASRDAAEAATRAKSEFLSTMSHEIRTPMNAIIGMCGLLLESHLRRDQEDFARIIRSSADTLMSLLNDVLDLSRIEAGRMDIDQAPFDLRRTVEEAAGMLALAAAEKGIELAVQFPPQMPRWYSGDAAHVRQVLVNLVSNAVKFTDAGHVLVAVTARDDAGLSISVSDTGAGIAPERQRELFSPFTRIDASTTRRHGGAGLGLAISRRLAELMGGDIELQSTPGEGSRFTLRLRLSALPDAAEAGPSPSLAGKRVLLVEPRALTRGILADWCRHWGMRVDDAPGCTGFSREGADPYAVCVVSGDVPPLPELAGVPLVRLASHNHPPAAGEADGVVYRPVCAGELRAALENALRPPHGGETPHPEAAAPAPSVQDRRVLLVEDNAVNRRLATLLLRRMGCVVETAENGVEAVDRASREEFDLVLMDCQMPRMDGYQASASIRALPPPGGEVPIVALTAEAISGDREKCLAAGMDDYLTKPIRVEALRDRVEQWAGRRHAVPAPV